jgi:hypothetical protein
VLRTELIRLRIALSVATGFYCFICQYPTSDETDRASNRCAVILISPDSRFLGGICPDPVERRSEGHDL